MEREERTSVTIVIASHVCPVPETHGNRRRLAALLRWLRERGIRLVFVLQPLDVDGPDAVDALKELVDEVVVVARSFRGRGASGLLGSLVRRFRRAAGGTGSRPTNVDDWCWPATCRAVKRAVRRARAMAVISEYVLLSRCLDDLPPGILRIIDTTEVFFRTPERYAIPGLQAPFIGTADSEKEGLSRADVLIAIQRNDADALRALFPEKTVITMSYSRPVPPRNTREPTDGVVLYVGSPNRFNVHGLREFLAEGWPLILEARADATLRVVGKFPQFEGGIYPRVVFVGRISDDDLETEYRRASVVINPQVAGTGLKIKCVEAIGAGCPTVMLKAGADGLEEGAGSAFLVADTWEQFAHDVARLLNDRLLRERIEAGARSFAERTLSPEAVFSGLEAVLCRQGLLGR